MENIPVGRVPDGGDVPAATAADIPELAGRTPTHNEAFLIGGTPVQMGSSNVQEIWWNWQARRLFVRFLDGSLYAYEDVPLSVAVGMVETDSPGRYVWNVLRDRYAHRKLSAGTGTRKPAQVVRLHNKK